jgi:hypothetical protein
VWLHQSVTATPAWAFRHWDWCYIAPVAPPDLVRALVEALEEARNELCVYEGAATGEHYNNTKINVALDRAKEAGV